MRCTGTGIGSQGRAEVNPIISSITSSAPGHPPPAQATLAEIDWDSLGMQERIFQQGDIGANTQFGVYANAIRAEGIVNNHVV
jgi:hypothetical protein